MRIKKIKLLILTFLMAAGSCFTGRAAAEELGVEEPAVSGTRAGSETGKETVCEAEKITGTESEDLQENIVITENAGGDNVFSITSLKVSELKANERFLQLSFCFTDGEGESYRCLLTGLEKAEDESSDGAEKEAEGKKETTEEKRSEKEGKPEREDAEIESVYEDTGFMRLAEDIAESCLEEQVFDLSEESLENEYGLKLHLVDAEKTDARSGGEDSMMCWAASAANVLFFTGWNSEEQGHSDEDRIYGDFLENFSNGVSWQGSSINWYLNGINLAQDSTLDNEMIYGEEESFRGPQQRREGSGGYAMDYAAGTVVSLVNDIPDSMEAIRSACMKLEEGYGILGGAGYYNASRERCGGHALTLFGYVRKEKGDPARDIVSLFAADSEDDAKNGESSAREERPNRFRAYPTELYKGADMYGLKLIGYDSEYTAVIMDAVPVMPRSCEALREETEGTKDPRSGINLIPGALRLTDREDEKSFHFLNAGQECVLYFEIRNNSYKALPKGCIISYVLHIKKDGRAWKDTEGSRTPDIGEDFPTGMLIIWEIPYSLDEAGEYTYQLEITGVTDSEGNAIREAYTEDNLYEGLPIRVNVY